MQRVSVIKLREIMHEHKQGLPVRLDISANSLLHELVEHWNGGGRREVIQFSTRDIMEDAGFDCRRALSKAFARLIESGFIEGGLVKGNGKNWYSFSPLLGTDKAALGESLGNDKEMLGRSNALNISDDTYIAPARFTENREQRTENNPLPPVGVAAEPWVTTATDPADLTPAELRMLERADANNNAHRALNENPPPEKFHKLWEAYPSKTGGYHEAMAHYALALKTTDHDTLVAAALAWEQAVKDSDRTDEIPPKCRNYSLSAWLRTESYKHHAVLKRLKAKAKPAVNNSYKDIYKRLTPEHKA